MGDDSVAADQLISYVRRIESLEDESKAINDDKSEVYKEARGNGFDTKIIRKVIAKRRLGSAERDEQDALFQLYWDAIHGVVRAHVENIEEFDRLNFEPLPNHDPETGEVIPGNGAGGTGEEASVATYGAASSDSIQAETPNEIPSTNEGGANETAAAESEQHLIDRRRQDDAQEGVSANDVEVRTRPVNVTEEPGRSLASDETPAASDIAAPIPFATAADPAGANDDRGGEGTPSSHAATVVTLQFRTHNPETHFLSRDGLLRLHGCQKPELCASGQPRLKLCFACSVAHDGPTHGEVA